MKFSCAYFRGVMFLALALINLKQLLAGGFYFALLTFTRNSGVNTLLRKQLLQKGVGGGH